ncbi:hypothetical protein CEXT_347121 [Caerostris extrusa]|uniref:Uncharacterized protein n=1 Tax=Caerostris extrusa TaxID=172846 RepID=A0AAV4VE63_CAEEX|nr:hypothetical protein CEXT_347121 [Caerostris extrusa]
MGRAKLPPDEKQIEAEVKLSINGGWRNAWEKGAAKDPGRATKTESAAISSTNKFNTNTRDIHTTTAKDVCPENMLPKIMVNVLIPIGRHYN